MEVVHCWISFNFVLAENCRILVRKPKLGTRITSFDIVLSVPLFLEYEDVAKRTSRAVGLRHSDIDDILNYLCSVGEHREIFFLWRPFLKDPMDDMVLEVAVESNCDYIVTHNIKDFAGIEKFGLEAIRPGKFLRKLVN